MFSHSSNSCTTPQCRSCRSKDHPTEDHLTDTPLWCVNCKGNHDSLHKECNTHRIRLGLKPIPNKNMDTNKRTQNNSSKDPHPGLNQRGKEKGKGKEREPPQERDLISENIGLSNDNMSLLANNPSWIEQCKHTAKLIHNQAKDKLTIKIPPQGKPNNTPTPKLGPKMEIDKPTATSSQ